MDPAPRVLVEDAQRLVPSSLDDCVFPCSSDPTQVASCCIGSLLGCPVRVQAVEEGMLLPGSVLPVLVVGVAAR